MMSKAYDILDSHLIIPNFGYQLKAKTPIRSRSQPARVSADLPVYFISPYVGSPNFYVMFIMLKQNDRPLI